MILMPHTEFQNHLQWLKQHCGDFYVFRESTIFDGPPSRYIICRRAYYKGIFGAVKYKDIEIGYLTLDECRPIITTSRHEMEKFKAQTGLGR